MISERSDLKFYVLQLNCEPWRVGPLSVGRGSKGGVYPIVGRDQQLYNYQQAVRSELKRQRAEFVGLQVDDIGYELVFYFHHVLESYQTASGRTAKDKEADLTNLVKATEDAIQGVLIDNDQHVVKQTNYLTRSRNVAGVRDAVPFVVIGVGTLVGMDPNELPAEVWEGVDIMMAEHRAVQVTTVELPEQDVF